MVLKKRIKKLEDVDEAFRAHYQAEGDGFVLKLEADDDDRKLEEFRTNNRNLFKEKTELEQRLKALETQYAGLDPAKVDEARQALEVQRRLQDKKLIDEGKVDELVMSRLAPVKEEHHRQLTAKDSVIKELQSRSENLQRQLGTHVINTEVQRAIAEVGLLRKDALEDVLARANRLWELDERGFPVAKERGQPKYGKEGNPYTMKEWAEHLRSTASHLFEPSQGGGAAGNQAHDTPEGKIVIDKNDPFAFGRNLDAILSDKAVVR